MLSEIHYLIRSKQDGQYLVARLIDKTEKEVNYLLIFKEDFEALSYLNTHSSDVAHLFGVESLPSPQLKTLLKRWGYQGIGLVEDPILPKIQFLSFS